MSEPVQSAGAQGASPAHAAVAAAVQAGKPVSHADGLSLYKAAKAAERSGAVAKGPNTEISEAARKLGQQGAKARQARQAEAPSDTQERPPEEDEEQHAADTSGQDTQGDLSEPEGAQSEEAGEAQEHESEPSEGETIDLGDGVTVTKEEVKNSYLRHADYTKKTTALAKRHEALNAYEGKQLSTLKETVAILEASLGQPKSLQQLVREDPDRALQNLAAQEERQNTIAAAKEVLKRHSAEATVRLQTHRDAHLAEHYNKEWADPAKRVAAYEKLTDFAMKRGADASTLQNLNHPWMIEVIDMASKYADIEAGKGEVLKTIADKPRVTKPGVRVSSDGRQQSQIGANLKALKSSGNVADAVELMRTLRKAGAVPSNRK